MVGNEGEGIGSKEDFMVFRNKLPRSELIMFTII